MCVSLCKASSRDHCCPRRLPSCNSSKIRALKGRCNHSYKHQSIAGVKEQGVFLSTLTAEYPPSLALQLAQVGIGRSVKQAPSDKHCHCTPNSPLHSSADWCCPKPEHPLQAVANPGCIGCMSANCTHIKNGSPHSPLAVRKFSVHSSKIALPFRREPRGRTAIQTPPAAGPGQLLGDPDMALLPFLQHGYQQVPCQPCHPSMAGKEARLRAAAGSGKEMAEDEPETVQGLLRNEIANNWIVETGLSIAEAREKLPLGIAVGKLNVVFAEGKEPRLVLDRTVCQVSCPRSQRTLQTPSWAPAPEEHTLLLFAFQGKLYHYRVCRFGGFLGILVAAHWRILASPGAWVAGHGLLAWKPHNFLFVDDLLCALFRDSAPDMFALVVLFFCAIAAPISWKKAQFQHSLVWCGWEINFSHDTIQLVSAKLTKLDALIKALLGNRRVPRKTLEQCMGLLIWATSIALHLRSWLAPLYSDLNTMRSIPPQMSAFRASLNKDLKTSLSLPGLWITVGSKILEISGRTMHCPQDIPQVPGTSKPTWVRVADPSNPYTSLSKSSQQCLTWLALCFQHSPVQPLARPHQLQALAAADACAEDDRGLGNHILPSGLVCRDLEHAGHTSRVALPWTAVHRMLRDAGAVSTGPTDVRPRHSAVSDACALAPGAFGSCLRHCLASLICIPTCLATKRPSSPCQPDNWQRQPAAYIKSL